MNKGFFQYGFGAKELNDPRYQDYLLADRKGLQHLRSKIDEVLDGADEVAFDSAEISTELAGIRIAGCYNPSKITSSESSGFVNFGCMALAIIALGVFILGAWKVVELALR